MLWKVSDGKITDYIRSSDLESAKIIFQEKHGDNAVLALPEHNRIQAVYFEDSYYPCYFKGTKTDARKGGQLYIRQWGLGTKISKIETI